MRVLMWAAGFFAIFGGIGHAQASDIGTLTLTQAQCTSVTLEIGIGSGWEASPNPNHKTYKVYSEEGPATQPLVALSDQPTIQVTGLQASRAYYLYAEARSRHKGGHGIPLYRKVGSVKIVTPPCGTANDTSPQPGDVRLRHEATGKCLFGDAVDGGVARTWTCWNDPQMAVSLEVVAGNEVRIRMRAKGKCLFGNPADGGFVKNWGCWSDPNMVFVREDLGNNRIRLRHKNSGKCMYGSTINGDAVRNWTCWADPNMVWVVDPF